MAVIQRAIDRLPAEQRAFHLPSYGATMNLEVLHRWQRDGKLSEQIGVIHGSRLVDMVNTMDFISKHATEGHSPLVAKMFSWEELLLPEGSLLRQWALGLLKKIGRYEDVSYLEEFEDRIITSDLDCPPGKEKWKRKELLADIRATICAMRETCLC